VRAAQPRWVASAGHYRAVVMGGSAGAVVKLAGGLTIAQDPASADHPEMPRAAIDIGAVDEVLRPAEIGRFLAELGEKEKSQSAM
jgi:chemotaxis response regulator CheB